MLSELVATLHRSGCSLVMMDTAGRVRQFSKKGVRDLEDLLDHEPDSLRRATIADKVVGKAAAGMMAFGGVSEVYADVLSARAVPMLKRYGIVYSYGQLVDHIVIADGDTRCHLEEIVAQADTAEEVVGLLRRHFLEMRQ